MLKVIIKNSTKCLMVMMLKMCVITLPIFVSNFLEQQYWLTISTQGQEKWIKKSSSMAELAKAYILHPWDPSSNLGINRKYFLLFVLHSNSYLWGANSWAIFVNIHV
jgi:hypothetical protein